MQHNHIHVHVYEVCGSNDVASEVFNGIPDPLHTAVSYMVIICGSAMQGQGKEVLELFSRMTEQGF